MKINVHEIFHCLPLSYLGKLMIAWYYIYIRNPNLNKWAIQLSINVDLIRLRKPLCNISEVHSKQHVAWHARLKKMKHQMKSRKSSRWRNICPHFHLHHTCTLSEKNPRNFDKNFNTSTYDTINNKIHLNDLLT